MKERIRNSNFRWPQACAEVITYRIPKRNLTAIQQTNSNITIQQSQQMKQIRTNGQGRQKLMEFLPLLLSLFIYFTLE